jgi:hypothetical protein
MTLLEVQRRMARATLRPLTGSDRIAPNADAGFIKPNDRLSSAARLEIYSRSYWFRVLDSLCDDFPGLRAVLGQRTFHRLSQTYLAECPSRSFTLRDLGSRLEDWLQGNPQFAGSRHALALDRVRLERAHIEAFDNAAEEVLGPGDLLELGPNFRARLQPYIRLLALQYPVDDLRIHLKKRVRRLKAEQVFLAVHRIDSTVYYRRIAAEEYRLLAALREGQAIGTAIRLAFENSLASTEEQRSMLEKWFALWVELGWLARQRGRRERG